MSEEPVQRSVADRLGLEHVTMRLEDALGGRGLLGAGLELSRMGPAPLQNVWAPAYQTLAHLASSHGRRTILTGGGGDEWLTVTPLIAADYLRRGQLGELARYLAALGRSLHLPAVPLARNVLWTNGALPLARSAYRRAFASLAPDVWRSRIERGARARAAALPAWVAPDAPLRRALEERAAARVRGRAVPPRLGRGGHYFREMAITLDHPLFAIDIEEIFALAGLTGLPQVDVYWDADLIEFLYRVPPRLLNRGGRSKGMVRDDVARRFPGLGFDRQRKLLSRDFFTDTVLNEAPSAWRALGGVPALHELGIADAGRADALVRDVVERRDARRVDDLWRLMSLEAWVRPRMSTTEGR